MKLISRNTDYAVRAVCYIAGCGGKIITVPELVSALKISKPFLRKILQILTKKGILNSQKGSGGGFKLARKPSSIYLLDLMRFFQGPFELNRCTLNKEICPNRKTCWLKKKIDRLENNIYSELKTITIASILKGD